MLRLAPISWSGETSIGSASTPTTISRPLTASPSITGVIALALVTVANAVRLQLHALAYNLGNFLRSLATPEPIKDWSLTSLKEKLIKIGAKLVSHGRYVAFQMAEVAVPRSLFAEILQLIGELRPPPDPAPA